MSDDRSRCLTLVDCLALNATTRPSADAFVFLPDGSDREEKITWREFHAKSAAIASLLADHGLAGKPAILAYPAGIEYLAAFFGCLMAGCYAVPVHPPRRNRSAERLQSIVADSTATTILTTEALAPGLRDAMGNDALSLVATGALPESASGREPVPPSPESIAFIQYTSGSVASPKGVVVTHGNLLANERMIESFLGADATTNIVSWLPLFHDMGLIGMALQAVYGGGRCVLMPPESMLMNPVRWLRTATRYQGRVLGAPNFAWDMCAQRIRPEQREGIDLSSVLVAFNGSEPVRAETLDAFTAAWQPYGFDPNAWHPCYGLAEATLFVAGDTRTPHRVLELDGSALEEHRVEPARPGQEDVRRIVSCGTPRHEQELLIADPETLAPLPTGRVGEILVRGPNVAAGYWRAEEETRATFGCVVPGRSGEPWLRTGDLGFLDEDRLCVTGRIKDLIIVGGRNHYPSDIEAAVERSHNAVRPAGVAAFPVDTRRGEGVVVAVEMERTALRSANVAEIEDAVRRAVHDACDLAIEDCVFLRPGALPRTTSGKIRRRTCRGMFKSGEFAEA